MSYSSNSSSNSSSQPVPLGTGMTTKGFPAPNPNHPKEMKGKERKKWPYSPKPVEVYIRRLTRNVSRDHIMEIFPTSGKINRTDMPVKGCLPSPALSV